MKTLPMQCALNAERLLQGVRSGGILRARHRRSGLIHFLSFSDGTVVHVQKSAVDSLVRGGLLRSILWSGNNYDYTLSENPKTYRYVP